MRKAFGVDDQSSLLRAVRRSVEALVVFLFSILTMAVFAQVVARYVFNSPPAWTEELARFCQVWIILLTSSICIRKGSHLAVDYLGPTLPAFARTLVGVTIGILIVLYSAVVTFWGVKLITVGAMQVSPAMQVNMAFVYAVFPFAGALMAIEGTLVTLNRWKRGSEL